jgi:hypothetical protein
MSKRLRQLVIDAGIVPAQAVRLMKMWKLLEEDESQWDSAKQERTENELLDFVSEISRLLEDERELPEMKETALDVDDVLFKNDAFRVIVTGQDGYMQSAQALLQKDGCFIFERAGIDPFMTQVGNQIHHVVAGEVEETTVEIIQVMPLYVGEAHKYTRCRVQEVPKHAAVPVLQQSSEE